MKITSGQRSSGQKVVHKTIAHVAKNLALEAYEALARHDRFYKQWPDQQVFADCCWDMFVQDARDAMTELLTKDYCSFPLYTKHAVDDMKAEIYEALVIDGQHKGVAEINSDAVH